MDLTMFSLIGGLIMLGQKGVLSGFSRGLTSRGAKVINCRLLFLLAARPAQLLALSKLLLTTP